MSTELAKVEPQEVIQQSDASDKIVPFVEKYRGISMEPVSKELALILMAPVDDSDIEIRPDGMIYLPEIKYRRRLNQTFGPGGWALMPTSKFDMRDNTIMRQYALYAGGRFISEAVGEQEYIASNPNMTYATAAEGCKSNALMRCCKDLGIASELWDPAFIAQWIPKFCTKIWNHKTSKWNWRRKDREAFWWEKKEKEHHEEEKPSQDAPQQAIADEPIPEHPPEDMPHDVLISDAQRKRAYAIARSAGMNDAEFKEFIEKCGYKSSKDIRKSDYTDICSSLENWKR